MVSIDFMIGLSRTDSPNYDKTPAWNHSDADEKADDKKREIREDEFWDVFVHGDKSEALKLAETIMLLDPALYQAAIKVVADAMAVSMAKSPLEKIADSAARDYMNDAINDGSDSWTGE